MVQITAAIRLWLALFGSALALALAAAPASAQRAPNIKAALTAETDRPAPGSTVTLAFVMTPDKGWHGYWKNPGDSGMETQAAWTLPEGVTAGPLTYPTPKRLIVAGLMNYVYEGRYAQLVDLTIPAGLAPGTRLPIRVKLDYLACTDEICVPESATLAKDLIVGSGGAERRAEFDAWRAELPRPLGSPATFAAAGGKLRLAIPVPAAMALDDPYVFPLADGMIDYAAAQAISRSGDLLIVETEAGGQASGAKAIEGVLAIGGRSGLSFEAVPGTVPAAGVPIAAASEAQGGGESATAILAALAGALIGGLLLNIMPCVFPILSLKALSLAKAGGDEAAARRDALAYTAGAVLICLALGGALLALRASGAAAGWAFQLQDPRVILLLLLLVSAIALNLAGLFEIPAITAGSRLAASGGAAGSFWTGALAAFIATPCTGPFMGAALGAALVLPPAAALAVFAGLGLGLALPFLLLGFVPALRRKLPRPGPWMDRLRRILSIPMFLTALGLAWILGRQAGADGMALGLAAALVLGLGLWWLGRRQEAGSRAWLPLAPAALAAVAAMALVPTVATSPAGASTSATLPTEPFSETRLAALQAESRPVFVYFTADWCVTCKVNEKAALERQEVADSFAAKDVQVLVGDWTRGDAAIGRFLEKHGRSGVPLYLWYAPGKPVEVLPQVLTPSRLTELKI
ncbi:protein-disulfide reductase DsbD family protein [Allosphingosinicella indica]|uniref:Thiol:disulfide interchange protein n=1 Tax=Allosphingosinicella indica TaxID=941907 RepID=A0A1X7G403_9SPHN|nr:protein-disulfide reductase DsbD domain-containing protein [Allosphingosinicella indica]SMF63067.1 Thiol:disulfide interchange protein [Allosphingosinicella indica]